MPNDWTGPRLVESIQELFVEAYEPKKRLHIHENFQEFIQPEREQICEMKPLGLWYGFNDSWIDWCINNMGGWLGPCITEVILDESKILRVSNEEEFDRFQSKYWGIPGHMRPLDRFSEIDHLFLPDEFMRHQYIDWGKVAKDYCGVEIVPYLWSRRLGSMFYYGWDCESGIVWDKEAVVEMRPFAGYNIETNKFVRF